MVTFSVVAALNIAWAIAGQEAVNECRARSRSRSFRRAVARDSTRRLPRELGVDRRRLRRLLARHDIMGRVLDAAASQTDLMEEDALRPLLVAFPRPLGEAEIRLVADCLVAGLVATAMKRSSPLTQLLSRRLEGMDEALLALVNIGLDTQKAVEEALVVLPGSCDDVLSDLAEVSALVAEDAGFVCVVDSSTGPHDLRLEDGLYVERAIEARLLAELDGKSDPAPAITLSGEAGMGKTSLLWSTFRRLARTASLEHPVWFLRATSLVGGDGMASVVERAAACLSRRGGCPILLLDTVDVLLHEDAARERLVLLLRAVERAGGRVVASCRTVEASLLPREVRRMALGGYSTSELRDALMRHHGRFAVQTASPSAPDIDGLLHAVRFGTPLRPLLLRPLTLRMLFEVYAPDALPAELNTFGLFDEFWDQRVRRDLRPGSTAPTDDTDLTMTACGLALLMLASGKTSVSRKALRYSRSAKLVADADLDKLLRRGVVRGDSDQLQFFHQAFFEHAAAKGLVNRLGDDGLGAVVTRAEGRPTDPYLWPVVEQLMLHAGPMPSEPPWRRRALHRWLTGDAELPFRVAVSVYVQSPQPEPELLTLLTDRLGREDIDATHARLILSATQQMRSNRLPEILSLARAAWRSGRWQARRLVIELSPRVAATDPSAFRSFATEQGMAGYLAGSVDGPSVSDHFLLGLVLAAGAGGDAGDAGDDRDATRWALATARETLTSAAPSRARTMTAHLVTQLADNLDRIGDEAFEKQWLPLLLELSDGMLRDYSGSLSASLTNLIEAQAVRRRRPPEELLRAAAARSGLAAEALCRAGFRLLGAPIWSVPAPVAQMFEQALNVVPVGVLWEASTDIADLLVRRPDVVAVVSSRWADLIAEGDTSGLAGLLAFCLRDLPAPELLALVDRSASSGSLDAWDDLDRFGRLLVAAARAGHPTARARLGRLVAGDGTRHQRTAIAAQLEAMTDGTDAEAEALVRLALDTNQPLRIARVLRAAAARGQSTARLEAAIIAWLRQNLGAPSVERRRQATLLSCELSDWGVELDTDARADLPDPLAALVTERDPATMQHLLTIVHRLVDKSAADPRVAGAAAERLLDHPHEGVRTAAELLALSAIAAQSPDAWDEAWQIAFRPPVRTSHLRTLVSLTERAATTNPTDAAARFYDLAKAASRSLVNRSHRDWGVEIRRPLARLLDLMVDSDVPPFATKLARLDAHIGRAAVDVAFARLGSDFFAAADELLADAEVSAAVKQTVAKNKERSERPLGSSRWPELLDLLN